MEATGSIRVRAPATSANLGPAFDAAGLALDWWDELEVRPGPVDAIQVSGEQAELLPTGKDNLVAAAMRRLAEAAGVRLPRLHLSVVKGFPLGRGFGSSAAAVVLGLVAARRLVAPGLPEGVPFATAAHTGGRSALLPLALAGDAELLLPATEDLLHQPERLAHSPDAARLLELLREAGHAGFLSGA